MTEKLMKRIKSAIRRRLKNLELEEGIKVSLKLGREKWDFIREIVDALNGSTIYVVKGYTLIIKILLLTPSGRILTVPFFISYSTYSVPKPYFVDYLREVVEDKKSKLLIQASFSLNSAENRYVEFLRQKGLIERNECPQKIVFTLEESEYKLFEYLV